MNIEKLYKLSTEEKYDYFKKLTDNQKIELIMNFVMITEPLVDQDFGDILE